MDEIVKQITEEKFNAYARLTILPIADFFCKQICWFANKNEDILGTIVFDFTDSSFNCILMGRDEILILQIQLFYGFSRILKN